jgi:hypothetical protein
MGSKYRLTMRRTYMAVRQSNKGKEMRNNKRTKMLGDSEAAKKANIMGDDGEIWSDEMAGLLGNEEKIQGDGEVDNLIYIEGISKEMLVDATVCTLWVRLDNL